mmetsp:Transcript_1758/g.4984  ORF Transcript_1758/g.4984 Transcript_1758/m.4984 type:complete len:250 (-) Transcript_1758:178-927(-)
MLVHTSEFVAEWLRATRHCCSHRYSFGLVRALFHMCGSSYWSDDDFYSAAKTEALLIPNALTGVEMDIILNAAHLGTVVTEQRDCNEDPTLCEALRGVPYDKAYTTCHVAKYLHRGQLFQETHPELQRKLISLMRSQPGEWGDSSTILNVRCIELHTYSVGGGLLNPAHRDNGSALTMSVLLSHAREHGGGQFVTYEEGMPVVHEMSRGEAILFHSERLHNVSTLIEGTRNSLVIELWKGPQNVWNRFS